MRLKLLFLMAPALLALPAIAALAAIPETSAASRAANFVRAKQEADGGLGGFGAGQTWDTIYALRAAGFDPNVKAASGKTTSDFLVANAKAQAKPAAAAKAALAAAALGLDPKSVGGTNLLGVIGAGLDPKTGKYADDDFSQAVTILGLACTGNQVPAAAVAALKQTQLGDGGWGFGGASDADTTAIALQALIASGAPASDTAAGKAIAWLKTKQGADGGWGFDPTASNASSTAYVVQALIAAGEKPESAAYTKGGKTPVAFLLSQQKADGSFEGFDATYSTIQAIPALAGRTFCNAPTTTVTGKLPDLTAPTPSPSPVATATPLPPKTGTGEAAESREVPIVAGAGLALLAVAGGLLGAGSWRKR